MQGIPRKVDPILFLYLCYHVTCINFYVNDITYHCFDVLVLSAKVFCYFVIVSFYYDEIFGAKNYC